MGYNYHNFVHPLLTSMENIPPLSIFIFILIFIAGVITGLHRLYRRHHGPYSQTLQAILLISASFYMLGVALIRTNFYLTFPHLWRVFTSLAYVNVPITLLFVRCSLINRPSFKKTDLLFLLPFLIPLINMSSFFISDANTKLQIIQKILLDFDLFAMEEEGLMSRGMASWIRSIINISLIFGQILVLLSAMHHFIHSEGPDSVSDKRKYGWLCLLSVILLTGSLLTLIQFAFRLVPGFDVLDVISWSGAALAMAIMGQIYLDPSSSRNFSRPLPASELFF